MHQDFGWVRHSSPTVAATSLTSRTFLYGMLGATLFAGLTFLGANIRIPLQPVPITLQTLFVLLSGAVLGARFAIIGQGLYLGLGILGLPILAGAAGLAVISGPTGGYLLGFMIAPFAVAKLVHRRQEYWWHAFVFAFASLIIVSLGVLHLTVFYTHDLSKSLLLGFYPFLIGDALKVLAATSIYRCYRSLRRSWSS